jgi:hypothetical protein
MSPDCIGQAGLLETGRCKPFRWTGAPAATISHVHSDFHCSNEEHKCTSRILLTPQVVTLPKPYSPGLSENWDSDPCRQRATSLSTRMILAKALV